MVDEARERLDAFRRELSRLEPRNPGSRDVMWLEPVREGPGSLVLQVGVQGGRWELDVTHEGVQFLEDVVRSVLAGRVVETFGPGRSRVTVTLLDGEVVHQEAGTLLGVLPAPGWRQWGRTVTYEPYATPGA